MKQRVCIVGAGCSGLGAIKICLENGFEPVCFEKETDIGGMWNLSEDASRFSVYDPIKTLSSKIFHMYSDFPFRKEDPIFCNHDGFQQYLKRYAEHFGLLQHIQFATEVIQVAPKERTSDVVSWDVTYNKANMPPSTDEFDGVIICSGCNQKPLIPEISGMDTFQGTLLHSMQVKRVKEVVNNFKNNTILVVGMCILICIYFLLVCYF